MADFRGAGGGGGGLANIVEDLTPQLGGHLDTNGQQVCWSQGVPVASVSPLVLGTDGNEFNITGSVTITSIASLGVGTVVVLHFDSNISLLHDPTNLILPGAGNIAAKAGDIATFYEYATADWRCVAYTRADGTPIVGAVGKQTLWIPAGAMIPTISAGCAPLASVEVTSTRPNLSVLDFADGADLSAQFTIAFPKRWNLSTVSHRVFWTVSSSVTTSVVWRVQGVGISNTEAIDAAYGTFVPVTDTALSGVNELLVADESTAMTIAGALADNDACWFRIQRQTTNGSDTMVQAARLLGIKLFWTSDVGTDD